MSKIQSSAQQLSSRGQNVYCTRCGSDEFRDFARTESGRATAVCNVCGERILIFGAYLLDQVGSDAKER